MFIVKGKTHITFLFCMSIIALLVFSGCDKETNFGDFNEFEHPAEEPDDTGAFDKAPPELEEIEIIDADRSPDTVIATVDGKDIVLQDLYDRFEGLEAPDKHFFQYQQAQLLESLVKTELLLKKAAELNISESDAYLQTLDSIKNMGPMHGLDEDLLEEYALVETLITKEVFDNVEVDEEELRDIFEQYKPMLGEEVEFEEIESYLEREAVMPHVEKYIDDLLEDADVQMDEDWIAEKEEEAIEAFQGMPMMPQ